MKRLVNTMLAVLFAMISYAQIGIGTTTPNSTLDVKGSVSHSIVTKTTSYTATASDHTIICNNSGGITISLPPASGATGRVYVIKKISGLLSNVTINPNGSETIDGFSTRILTLQFETAMIQCDGTGWFILSWT